MGLTKQTFDMPLAVGLDTRTDSKMFAAPKFKLLENCTFSKTLNALRKRYGYTPFPQQIRKSTSTTTIGSTTALFGADDWLAQSTAGQMFQLSANEGEWSTQGFYTGWGVRNVQINPEVTDVSGGTPDFASSISNGNFIVRDNTAYVVSSRKNTNPKIAYLTYLKEGSADRLWSPELSANALCGSHSVSGDNAQSPLIFDYGTDGSSTFPIIVTTQGGSCKLFIPPSDLAVGSINPTTVTDGANDLLTLSNTFDADMNATVGVWAAMATGSMGSAKLRIGKFTVAGAFGDSYLAATTLTADGSPVATSLSPDGSKALTVYYDAIANKTAYILTQMSDMTTIAGAALDGTARSPKQVTCCWSSNTSCQVLWEIGDFIIQGRTVSSAGVLGTQHEIVRHSQLASHLFRVSDRLYYHTVLRTPLDDSQSTQNSLYLFRVGTAAGDDPKLASSVLGVSLGLQGKVLVSDALPPDEDGQDCLPKPQVSSTVITFCYADSSARLHTIYYDITGPNTHAYTTFHGQRIVSGPMTYECSDSGIREQGFPVFPEGVTAVASNSSGSLTGGSSYSYRTYYRRTDAAGRRTVSGISGSVTVSTGASDDTVTLTCPTLSHHTYPSNVISGFPAYQIYADFYRTEANGAVYYYVGSSLLTLPPTSDSFTFTDGAADASINTGPTDPGSSSEQFNFALSASRYFATSSDRVWSVSAENPKQVFYSKLRDQDFALEFVEGSVVEFPVEIRAVGFINNNVIGFSDNSIYGFAGSGPDNTGVGDFGAVLPISLTLGCINEKTLVEIPTGYIFLSDRGFWLIDRGLSFTFIGSDVAAYNDADFVNGNVIPEKNQAIWFISDGTALGYDYELRQWFVYTGLPGTCATTYRGLHVVGQNGLASIEDSTVFTDNGTPILMAWETGDIKLSTIQGFGRLYDVYLLGEEISSTQFKISFAKDYKGTYRAGRDFDSSKFPSCRVRSPQQKCSSFRLKFEEQVSTGTQEGVTLNALSFRVGIKEGTAKRSVSVGE